VASSALNARHNPSFFARRRGLTLYSHTSSQGPQFWVDVVNCLMREATYVLDGLVYQDILPIYEHYTDTHGSTDLIFGLFEILGYRFAPRLRDLPDQVLYRARKGADYGALYAVRWSSPSYRPSCGTTRSNKRFRRLATSPRPVISSVTWTMSSFGGASWSG